MTPLDFEKLRVIGRGAYGKVFLVQKISNGQHYAMKKMRKEQVILNNVKD